MQRIRPDVDIIREILEAVLAVQTESSFTKSLLHQYMERGTLSKKQLQGLYGKASKIPSVNAARLATLDAIILRKPTRYRPKEKPVEAEEPLTDNTGEVLDAILEKYPAHKRVLFLKSKFDHKEPMSAAELAEIGRFEKLLGK